jgi:hypothetical protein
VAYDYEPHHEVFLIYRPWEHCQRCAMAISSGTLVLPETGDITCQHTRRLEYEAITAKGMGGLALIGKPTEIVQKDGTVCISLAWYLPKLDPKRMREIRKREARENGLPPPEE